MWQTGYFERVLRETDDTRAVGGLHPRPIPFARGLVDGCPAITLSAGPAYMRWLTCLISSRSRRPSSDRPADAVVRRTRPAAAAARPEGRPTGSPDAEGRAYEVGPYAGSHGVARLVFTIYHSPSTIRAERAAATDEGRAYCSSESSAALKAAKGWAP